MRMLRPRREAAPDLKGCTRPSRGDFWVDEHCRLSHDLAEIRLRSVAFGSTPKTEKQDL
jgi:hypothetical protein